MLHWLEVEWSTRFMVCTPALCSAYMPVGGVVLVPTSVASVTPAAPSVPPLSVTAVSAGAAADVPMVATTSCDGPRTPDWPWLIALTRFNQMLVASVTAPPVPAPPPERVAVALV